MVQVIGLFVIDYFLYSPTLLFYLMHITTFQFLAQYVLNIVLNISFQYHDLSSV